MSAVGDSSNPQTARRFSLAPLHYFERKVGSKRQEPKGDQRPQILLQPSSSRFELATRFPYSGSRDLLSS